MLQIKDYMHTFYCVCAFFFLKKRKLSQGLIWGWWTSVYFRILVGQSLAAAQQLFL